MFPAMSSWTDWCYGSPTMLLYDHKHIIESEAGVQQGDPLGPLYFCCGIMPLVNEINALLPVYNKWYMDDGGIVADVPTLLKVWDLLKSRGPALGLHLNPSKCEWSWLNPERADPCPIRLPGVSDEGQVKLVPHAEIQMLGVPLGSDAFVGKFVGKKLLDRLESTISKLVEFEDSQSAFYLLRVSFSIVRAVHFMRTTPLSQWRAEALEFDRMLRKAAEDIFGFPMSDFTYAQAALTPKLGGLGLRKTVEHADFAFNASWHEAKLQAKEDWKQPPVVGEYVAQKSASYAFDEHVLQFLVDQSDTRNAQRLRRVAQPHAGGFITAVPSEEDGNDTVLRPRNFRTAVAYRLGIPLLKDPIPCPLCMQTINVYGDHATCCTFSGDLIVRHNAVRNFVHRIAGDALLSPVLEKQGILGPTSGRRPGDVTVPLWAEGKGMAIDVAITSPLNASSVSLADPCEEYAATKHKKYDASFQGQPFFFSTLVLETLGAINAEGDELMRQLFRFAAKRVGREFSSFCGRGWARLSCNLQRCVSQMILARTEGASGQRVPPAVLPASVPVVLPASAGPARPVPSLVPPSATIVSQACLRPPPAQMAASPAPQARFVPVVDLLSSVPLSGLAPRPATPVPLPSTPARPFGSLPYWMSSPPVALPLCLATPPVKHSVLGATKCLTQGCPYLTFSACGFCDVPEARCWSSHFCTLPQHRVHPEIPPFPDLLKGVCGVSGKEGKDAHTPVDRMQPKQLSTAGPAARGPGFAFSPPSLPASSSSFLRTAPFSLPLTPTHSSAIVSQSPQVDLGSSSFGHTGLSPYHLSVCTRREDGGGREGVAS
jgi:hypothetical protein